MKEPFHHELKLERGLFCHTIYRQSPAEFYKDLRGILHYPRQ